MVILIDNLCKTKTTYMKIYILAFLMFWFNTLFAPEKSNSLEQFNKLNQESAKIETKVEVNRDSIDLLILAKYQMNKKFTKSDRKKVRLIADDLGIKTKWLYKIIFAESGGNTKAVNKQWGDPREDTIRIKMGRATGLIQFLPSTAIGLGTTTQNLYNMTISEQLDYIHKYYKKALIGKRRVRESTLYLATFVPAMVGRHDSTIIETPHTNRYSICKANKRFDLNKDSVITIREVDMFISLL